MICSWAVKKASVSSGCRESTASGSYSGHDVIELGDGKRPNEIMFWSDKVAREKKCFLLFRMFLIFWHLTCIELCTVGFDQLQMWKKICVLVSCLSQGAFLVCLEWGVHNLIWICFPCIWIHLFLTSFFLSWIYICGMKNPFFKVIVKREFESV